MPISNLAKIAAWIGAAILLAIFGIVIFVATRGSPSPAPSSPTRQSDQVEAPRPASEQPRRPVESGMSSKELENLRRMDRVIQGLENP